MKKNKILQTSIPLIFLNTVLQWFLCVIYIQGYPQINIKHDNGNVKWQLKSSALYIVLPSIYRHGNQKKPVAENPIYKTV